MQHRSGLIDSPWALTDRQFACCIFTLREGRDPDGVKYLEKGVVKVGGTAIGFLIKANKTTWVGSPSTSSRTG